MLSIRQMGLSAVLAALTGAIAVSATACFDARHDCERNPLLRCGSWAIQTHDGGTGGDDGGTPPGCIPSENVEPVAGSCGVFVSSSLGNDASGKGTQDAPFATLTKAIELAQSKGKPVYACGEKFDTEAVSISTDVTLYGALDCANKWKYEASKKTELAPSAEGVALNISKNTTSVEVFDFAITSADATQDGGSSMAVLVAQASASFTRCDVTSGMGKAGAPGAFQTQVMTPADANGQDGTDDAACNVSSVISGGAGGTNNCDGTATDGGKGGKGVPASTGDNGSDGLPMMTPGNGGVGQTASASCDPGTKGKDGSAIGASMAGTGAHGIGDVSASGYQGPAATLGGAGVPGQGGGGGGAALACDSPTNNFSGPSGGGGGAGGCGGAPGNPGQSGGSSIGILALGANLTLTTVTITAKSGGAGGLGGDGQKGGSGGQPGGAFGNACGGAKGGQGGAGGPGGGGGGGHSIAVAVKGGKLPDLSSTTIQHDDGATGGAGGDMDMSAQTKGDSGLGCRLLDFTTPASPSACVK